MPLTFKTRKLRYPVNMSKSESQNDNTQTQNDNTQTQNTNEIDTKNILEDFSIKEKELQLRYSIEYEKKLEDQMIELKNSYDLDLQKNIAKISASYNKIIKDLDREHKEIISPLPLEKPKLVRQNALDTNRLVNKDGILQKPRVGIKRDPQGRVISRVLTKTNI